MNTMSNFSQGVSATLSISDLANRTGLTAATLRMWESRHGFPEPVREPGRHRRYTEAHVVQVREVLQHRTDGLTLEAAIHEVARRTRPKDRSIYAGLRRTHPQLMPHRFRKSTLLALTHAMEDECCARAENPVLMASFQHAKYYEKARARWRDLARTSQAALVFADFSTVRVIDGSNTNGATEAGGPLVVHVPHTAPMQREWTLVCDAPDYPVCLAAWEIPGQTNVRDMDRVFESVWTLDPVVVRDATRVGLDLAHAFAPELADELPAPPSTPPAEASADLREATSLFTRLLTYLERRTA